MSRAWADIDLGRIAHNTRVLRELAAPAEVCAVVKANGYGHGAVEVARAAVAAGATRLAVAQVAEGMALRAAGLVVPIWVLSEPDPAEMATAVAAGLEPAVYSPAAIDAASAAAAAIGETASRNPGVEYELRRETSEKRGLCDPERAEDGGLPVHLKIDTGMHRVGAAPGDAVALARRIVEAPGLLLGSVWTHLACADSVSPAGELLAAVTDAQLARYERVLADLAAAGIDVPLRHVANSAGTIAHPAARYDVVRCGIALYGLPPAPEMAGWAPLRPAMSWRTRVSFVKRVAAGESISYGHRRTLGQATTVATVPVGYADGLPRGLWANGGSMLVGGRPRAILGVVTMDQTMVDCGDDEVQVGDEAVIIGPQGAGTITADDLAAAMGTINYEICTSISPRVARRYHPA
ncbi:MAG: alanine racemase [Acidimicrobiia bacterium]|nr:alanine racemase [Acidimicrobiia bacterium]MDH4362715.1 alanine racemase [Acidimicrobiia bacterium]